MKTSKLSPIHRSKLNGAISLNDFKDRILGTAGSKIRDRYEKKLYQEIEKIEGRSINT